MITSEKQNTPKTEKKRNYSTDSVPYKRIISNLEGNFERFHKYGLIPSLLKFSDLHTVLIVVNTLMVTFK